MENVHSGRALYNDSCEFIIIYAELQVPEQGFPFCSTCYQKCIAYFWRHLSRIQERSIDCLMQLKTSLVSLGRPSGLWIGLTGNNAIENIPYFAFLLLIVRLSVLVSLFHRSVISKQLFTQFVIVHMQFHFVCRETSGFCLC